jgi:uncharacterized Zn-binding protein involved in type VI secretion
MKPTIPNVWLILTLVVAAPAFAQQPAARVGDSTNQGGTIIGPGAPTVLIAGQPAARVTDSVTNPLVVGVVPCVGGQIVTGSSTVLIGGLGAARVGDTATDLCTGSVIITGAPTVLIGP